jgi:hypothetical protein
VVSERGEIAKYQQNAYQRRHLLAENALAAFGVVFPLEPEACLQDKVGRTCADAF